MTKSVFLANRKKELCDRYAALRSTKMNRKKALEIIAAENEISTFTVTKIMNDNSYLQKSKIQKPE